MSYGGITGQTPDLRDYVTQEELNTTLASGYSKTAVGTYTGNGSFGASSPVTLSFPFTPQFLFVCPVTNPFLSQFNMFFAIYGQTKAWVMYNMGNATGHYEVQLSWNQNTVSWYNLTEAGRQLNVSGVTYQYFIVG